MVRIVSGHNPDSGRLCDLSRFYVHHESTAETGRGPDMERSPREGTAKRAITADGPVVDGAWRWTQILKDEILFTPALRRAGRSIRIRVHLRSSAVHFFLLAGLGSGSLWLRLCSFKLYVVKERSLLPKPQGKCPTLVIAPELALTVSPPGLCIHRLQHDARLRPFRLLALQMKIFRWSYRTPRGFFPSPPKAGFIFLWSVDEEGPFDHHARDYRADRTFTERYASLWATSLALTATLPFLFVYYVWVVAVKRQEGGKKPMTMIRGTRDPARLILWRLMQVARLLIALPLVFRLQAKQKKDIQIVEKSAMRKRHGGVPVERAAKTYGVASGTAGLGPGHYPQPPGGVPKRRAPRTRVRMSSLRKIFPAAALLACVLFFYAYIRLHLSDFTGAIGYFPALPGAHRLSVPRRPDRGRACRKSAHRWLRYRSGFYRIPLHSDNHQPGKHFHAQGRHRV